MRDFSSHHWLCRFLNYGERESQKCLAPSQNFWGSGVTFLSPSLGEETVAHYVFWGISSSHTSHVIFLLQWILKLIVDL